jgi:hypothetical protein
LVAEIIRGAIPDRLLSALLTLALDLALDSVKQEQEADLDLRLFSEENSGLGEFSPWRLLIKSGNLLSAVFEGV